MRLRVGLDGEWVRHTYNVQLLVAEVESDLSRTGRVRQTYLQTGEQRYLQEIEQARAELFDKISQLKTLVQDNIDEEHSCETLEQGCQGTVSHF